MKEENVLVVWSIWSIAVCAMLLVGIVVYRQVDNSALMTALIMIPSNALSGLIGYLTKGLISKKEVETNEPK